jgi:hypothetical protein
MNRRTAIFGIVALALAALLLAGCEDGYYSSYPYAVTPCPMPFASPLDATAQAIALNQYATRSAVEVEAASAQMNATVQAVIAQATADAAQVALDQQREMATEQAARATQQAQATADAFNMSQTATARAIEATATERAYQAAATRQALDLVTTATAQALALAATATCQAWESSQTATAQSVQATQQSYQATQQAAYATATQQALQREEVLAYGRDYGIPGILLILLGCIVALVVYGLRQHAKRPIVIQRDIRGDAPLVVMPRPGGGSNLLDADRQPGPVLSVLGDGRVEAPQLRSAGQEERTTARDQVVDGMTRPRLETGASAPRNSSASPMPLAPPPTPPAPGLRQVMVVRRLDQAETAGALPPGMVAALEADWEVEE